MSRARLLALALTLGGCDATSAMEGAAERPAQPAHTPPRPAAADPASAARPKAVARARHALTVRAAQGGDAGLQVGAQLPENGEVVVARGAELSLALDEHVSLRVMGPARLLALPEGEPALLVRAGQVTVDCAPRAARTTASAFWLADAHARIDVIAGARFVLRSDAEDPSALAVVSGNVELSHVRVVGDRSAEDAHVAARSAHTAEPARVLLGPSVHCLGARRQVSSAPAPDLTRAEGMVATLSCGPAAVRPKENTEALAERLRTLLDAIAAGSAREQSLLSEHALRLREGADASALRGELAALGSELMRERQRARALRAMWEAAAGASSPDAEQRALADRARALAPYAAEQG